MEADADNAKQTAEWDAEDIRQTAEWNAAKVRYWRGLHELLKIFSA